MTDPVRIVIVGGGVAGIILATRLGRSHGRSGRASVTLVDRSLSHVWKPMLHTFAAGTARPDRQQVNFLAQAKASGFSFLAADLDGIDRHAKVAVVRPLGRREPNGGPLPQLRVGYDRLVLALGSRANDFGTPGVSDHCVAIDDLASAQTSSEAGPRGSNSPPN
jgi:NADH dehydrogenase